MQYLPENWTFLSYRSEFREKVAVFLSHWFDTSPAMSVQTSGSTGTPKTISLLKSRMRASAQRTLEFLHLQPDNVALLCLSIDTIAGKMMLVRALEGNLRLYLDEPSMNPLKTLNFSIDFVAMVPAQVEVSLNDSPEKWKLIKKCIVGGAPVSLNLIKQLKKSEITVYQTFGMTETISHIALRKIGLETESTFKVLNGISVTQKEGSLVIDSPELADEAIETNDLVELINPKEFEWKGRKDFVINSGGVKLFPEQIEDKLSNWINVPFYVSSVMDDFWGQVPILVLESRTPFSIEKNNLAPLVSKYELPKKYVFLNAFIRTESGKINRFKTNSLILENQLNELL